MLIQLSSRETYSVQKNIQPYFPPKCRVFHPVLHHRWSKAGKTKNSAFGGWRVSQWEIPIT
ncbi:hypothetical protein [Nodularia chucula]|uniref:hypothetical protein n=1 Tax=Nodularia chucula TaxID=3093667 RepID=UPI0039C66789